MKTNKFPVKYGLLGLLFIAICMVLFRFVLLTPLYSYFLYAFIAVAVYFMAKVHGFGIYIIVLIPVICFASEFTQLFGLDVFNENGTNPLKLHLSTFVLLIIFTVEFIEKSLKRLLIFDFFEILAYSFLVIIFLITLLKRGLGGMTIFFECFAGPMCFFILIRTYLINNFAAPDKLLRIVTKTIIGIAVAYSFFGIIEYITVGNLFDFLYEKTSDNWLIYDPNQGYRIKTLLGTPLVNATFFLFAMILTQIEIKNNLIKYLILCLLMLSILMTGTRSIFAISALALIYNEKLLVGYKINWKLVGGVIMSVVIVLLLMFFTPLGNTFFLRLSTQNGSVEARIILINYFLENFRSFRLLGLGGANTVTILNKLDQPVIMENPWIIMFIELNYFALIYPLIIYKILRMLKVKYIYLSCVLLLSISTFNSFGVKTNINYYVYFLFAYFYYKTFTYDNKKNYGLPLSNTLHSGR